VLVSRLADDITAILDGDCDATRVALYNPRRTVAAIRERLAKPEPEPTVDDAIRILNRDYFDDVRGIVEDCKRAIRDGEVSSDDELRDYLHESVDGCQRVIHTFQARCGLLSSDHPDAYEDETGERPSDVSVQMYWALMADVNDRLESYDELCEELEEERQRAENGDV